jgi:hypothetical protein
VIERRQHYGSKIMSSFRRTSRLLLFARHRTTLAAVGSVVLLATAAETRAQQPFKTADAAATALVSAVKAKNDRLMLSILGQDGAHVISSGDATEDARVRKELVTAYDAKHSIKEEGDKATLIVGEKDFPFPIPLVRAKGAWTFDTAAGREEVLARRIGRNELSAIQASLAYYDAQYEYAEKDRTGSGIRTYAQYIASHPGKKDGLYWPTALGGDESPLGALVANAASDGYKVGEARAPFHGYYYKILTKQGPAAKGGELDYVVNGKMIGGFALVAWPASYGVSGLKTFVVSHNGVVYEKDLGPRTARVAERMTTFDPGAGWETVRVTAPPPSEQ